MKQEGEKIPNVTFKTRVRDENVQGDNPYRWQDTTSDEIFDGKRIVLLSLPGAFTPTCSNSHLPEYEAKYHEIKALGIDEIYCVSVNDAFVMFQWAKHLGVKNVKMLPDGSCNFTKGMEMAVKKDNLGYGERSWRYSMVVNDGVIEKLFVEPNMSDNCPEDPFEISDAETMITYLKENKR